MFPRTSHHPAIPRAWIREGIDALAYLAFWCVAALLAFLVATTLGDSLCRAQAPTPPPVRVEWKRAPIPVDLAIGKERMITFPESIRLGLPPGIAPHLRVQVVQHTAYLFATGAFPPTRVVAENPVQGSVYLLDIAASDRSAVAPAMEIHLDRDHSPRTPSEPHPLKPDADGAEDLDYVQLTRFAAQHVYAPQRLLRGHPGVRAVVVDGAPLQGFYRLAALRAEPLGSWKSTAGVVTAVRLVNESQRALELDPRALRGRWLTATFQHSRLLPKGSEEDTTVVYVISERSFEESR